jgi:hypothetical protein
MNKNIALTLLATLTTLSLTACGERYADRTLSGAGIGAAAGTVGTVIGGGNPVTGAIIGGAVGGVVGAVTDPDSVNLGKPIWSK